jgi:pSer/pThr/pTyr-binding forkhead associated (FHA) protein
MRYRVRAESRTALLGDAEVVIGRSSYCSLTLEHASVSRMHATLRMNGEHVEVEDLGSSNGTWVNGKRISTATRITPGDALKLGSVDVSMEIAPQREAFQTGQRSAVADSDLDNDLTDERPTMVGRAPSPLGTEKPKR